MRTEFNTERPHEALRQRPPARIYFASPRPYPARLEEPSSAIRAEGVGLAETERGDWIVRFMHVELGRLDRHTRRFRPVWHWPRVGR